MTRLPTETTLPPQAAFYHAVLRHLSHHPEGDDRDNIYEGVADLLGLTAEQRSERLANLPHLRYRHRSGFAIRVLTNAEVIPSQQRIETVANEADLEDVYNTERHLLYVACTRARDHLLVTSVTPASEFLDDLRT
jgi:hypothetical protein